MTEFGPTDVPEKYRDRLLAAASKWGVPPALLAAQINQESGFNPSAVSPHGALGIAQFMPATAQSMNIDPLNVDEAIDGMARLMSQYHKDYGSWEKALIAYHGGPGAVDDPGPMSADYAKKILGKVGGLIGGAVGDVVDAVNPMPETTAILGNLRDGEFWRRVGIAILGALMIFAAVAFIVTQRGGSKALNAVKGTVGEGAKKSRKVAGTS